ncbi:MAG: TonB-dependent receptor [Candidatus Neomarinimicrobiota bacterium]|jgi:outer membrane receptor protein involved in Fe transport|nr:TonB-dependent receptor [Candidatus Neomarinimicrobiota bacterium]
MGVFTISSKWIFKFSLIILAFWAMIYAGTTGKITGTITDADTGEPLWGVNVIIEGTASGLGAATDEDGYYVILNVPPGTYSLKTAMIGYTSITEKEIEVFIDQTSMINFKLAKSVLQGDEVVVTAKRSIVHRDVSTSVLSVNAEEIETSIHTNVTNIIGEQAGIEGLQVRGGAVDETAFMVDGVVLRNPRTNEPITGIALSGIQNINVKRGGFEAEYGQVRGGIINVVTREGDPNKYAATVAIDYNPPEPDYFDSSPYSYNSYYNRPYYDDEVCWNGTSTWPEYIAAQYPEFEGWNQVSENTLTDDNPNNDLTPLGAQILESWRRRQEQTTNIPDINIDAGFGGPVPIIGEMLGDLRFFATYKRNRSALVIPLATNQNNDNNFRLKLNSNIASNIVLELSGMYGYNSFNAQNWSYLYFLDQPEEIARDADERAVFGTGYYSISKQYYDQVSATINHTLNNKSFYRASISQTHTKYRTNPNELRDTSRVYNIVPDFQAVDEAPFKWWASLNPYTSEPTTFQYGGHVARQRDSSDVYIYELKADYTNQINSVHQLKTGFNVQYTQAKLCYSEIQMSYENYPVSYTNRTDQPIQTAFYIQDKIETQGFIMNLGLRADLYSANTEWWDLKNPFDDFYSAKYNEEGADTLYTKSKPKAKITVSPRFGISHPITETSKLFFNYGHFTQLPAYEDIFRLVRADNRRVTLMGNADLRPAKTVAYELGLDKSIADQFLFRVSAYYRDITDQYTTTRYIGTSGVDYELATNNSYADIRGIEISLDKTRGRWFTMLANFTYQASSYGEYGRTEVHQDPSKQEEYDKDTQLRYQTKPVPQPYARVNTSLHTPSNFGPKVFSNNILGAWDLTVYLDWKAEGRYTFNPNGVAGIVNNIRTPAYFNIDLKLGKKIPMKKIDIFLYSNVFNVLNIRRLAMLWGDPAAYSDDLTGYQQSLHLPKSKAYNNIPGNDRYGDFRDSDTDYQPCKRLADLSSEGQAGYYYYISEKAEAGEYEWYYYDSDAGAWQEVDKSEIKQVLNKKAYIDMPNRSCFNFFWPRNITFGIKIAFNL